MTTRRSLLPAAVAFVAFVPLVAVTASADPPAAAGSASATTSATVPAGALGSAPRPAVSGSAALALPRFQDDLPPEGKTPVPTNAEWESGLPIRFDRPLPATCSARKVREWVRVHCNHMGARIAFLAGDPLDC